MLSGPVIEGLTRLSLGSVGLVIIETSEVADSEDGVKALIIDEPAGHNLIAYREWLSANDIATTFTKATGIPSKAIKDDNAIPPGISDELLGEMIDCFSYFNEFGYEGRDDPTVVHPRDLKFAPKLSTAEEYFKKQDWSKALDLRRSP
ncbi:nitrogen metabolic regulation nmr [Fusarium agapanthi]|uniref:Nitrogen metabolic regulation nmr n=1 Tax=Fusarium agapanthi TaxID=1803897 RepID=A0A9P5BJJ9_9HYPO|nr:nitrogen metabolic regulation nmr [Fusarium agapanthi]